MPDNSFDVVSRVDMNEVANAINQTMKEVSQRFDFKGSKANVALEGSDLIAVGDDEFKLKSLLDILQGRLVKRGVSLKNLTYGKIEAALGGTVRQKVTLQQGIPTEKAKAVVKLIKDRKLKVQASIQGDTVRVSGKDRDILQEVIALLRKEDFGLELQFTNYRTN